MTSANQEIPLLAEIRRIIREELKSTQPSSPYWTTKEAARYLRISEGRLANLRCESKGPKSTVLTGKVLYKVDDVVSWAESKI